MPWSRMPVSQGKPDDRKVPPVAEVLADAAIKQAPDVAVGEYENRLLGHHSGRVFLIGDAWISPSSSSHLKSC
jgi:hypothetical protein